MLPSLTDSTPLAGLILDLLLTLAGPMRRNRKRLQLVAWIPLVGPMGRNRQRLQLVAWIPVLALALVLQWESHWDTEMPAQRCATEQNPQLVTMPLA